MNRSLALMTTIVLLQASALAGCDGKTSSTGTPAPGASQAAGQPTAPKAAGKLTEEDVKKFVTRKEQNLATGVGSSHKSVTVDFQEIQFGATRAPNERDKFDGIRSDTVYPVRVKFTSHRTWGNGETEDKVINYNYDFYTNDFSEWDALLQGPAT